MVTHRMRGTQPGLVMRRMPKMKWRWDMNSHQGREKGLPGIAPGSYARGPMKTGRNEPCPCGSGRKYKHCCLAQVQTDGIMGSEWRELRRTEEGLERFLLALALERYGPEFF